jgi:argininosuccinate lyase
MKITELRKFSESIDKDLFDILTPKASVNGKTSPGGTAPALVVKRTEELLKEPPQ